MEEGTGVGMCLGPPIQGIKTMFVCGVKDNEPVATPNVS